MSAIFQHGHPYISAMINNGTLHYDHDRDRTHTELAGCEAQFRNKPHDTYVAIRYERNTLTVRFFSKFLLDQGPFCGVTDCFYFGLRVTLLVGFKARVVLSPAQFLACMQ